MQRVDRLLQRWRISKALPWIRNGDRLLDVGCYDLSMMQLLEDRIACGLGLDPLAEPYEKGPLRMQRGMFPDAVESQDGEWDCITMLAVLEHVDDPDRVAEASFRLLSAGGRVIITVPHPRVDRILEVLIALRIADGMSLEEHHGFDPLQTTPIFERAGFRLETNTSFQLGLNRLFVFEKPERAS